MESRTQRQRLIRPHRDGLCSPPARFMSEKTLWLYGRAPRCSSGEGSVSRVDPTLPKERRSIHARPDGGYCRRRDSGNVKSRRRCGPGNSFLLGRVRCWERTPGSQLRRRHDPATNRWHPRAAVPIVGTGTRRGNLDRTRFLHLGRPELRPRSTNPRRRRYLQPHNQPVAPAPVLTPCQSMGCHHHLDR